MPAALPVADGAKVTFKVAVCPAAKIVPVETPPALKPAPETLKLEMVMFVVPELVKVTGRVLLAPTFTLLKFKLVVLLVNAPGSGAAASSGRVLAQRSGLD